jgi:ABC-type glycerol-3-phosphate transport system substrate-binding protein
MKRKFFVSIMLIIACAFVVAGGGGQASSGGTTSSGITLDFPHWFFSHGEAFNEWMEPAVRSFEQKNPGVKVNGYAVAYEEYWDKLDIAIAANSSPDVFAPHNGNISKYIQAGSCLPLDTYINMADFKANSSTLQTVDVPKAAPDGKTYLIITDLVHYLPMYRPSVWKQAGITTTPKTPEEFIAAMKKLKSVPGLTPYGAMTNPGNWAEQNIDLNIWVIALGGHIIRNAKPNLDSKEVIQAFTYLKELYDSGCIVKDTDKGTYRQMFATKRVGTLIDGQFMFTMLEGWDKSINGDYEVLDLPFPTQNCSAGYEGVSASSTTKYKNESAALCEWLGGFEQQRRIVDITGIGSTRLDVFKDTSFTDSLYRKWPWMRKFAEHTDTVLACPPDYDGIKYPELQKIFSRAFERVLYENVSPARAAADAQAEALKL